MKGGLVIFAVYIRMNDDGQLGSDLECVQIQTKYVLILKVNHHLPCVCDKYVYHIYYSIYFTPAPLKLAL